MNKRDKLEIKCPYIIVCEGRDLESFMINYLGHLCTIDSKFEKYQAMDFGGVNELKRQLATLRRMPDFFKIKGILIIRDAEKCYDRAENEIKAALKNNDAEVPSRAGEIVNFSEKVLVTYLILPKLNPDEREDGTLEDLCLELVCAEKHAEIGKEIEKYLTSLKNEFNMLFPRIHKNKLHLLISSYDKYVDSKAGEAGKRGMYDFDSEKLKYLRETLSRLLDKNNI